MVNVLKAIRESIEEYRDWLKKSRKRLNSLTITWLLCMLIWIAIPLTSIGLVFLIEKISGHIYPLIVPISASVAMVTSAMVKIKAYLKWRETHKPEDEREERAISRFCVMAVMEIFFAFLVIFVVSKG